MDLKETESLGAGIKSHWYYRSKARAVAAMIGTYSPSTVLDVGSGSGYFSRYLLANSCAAEAWCIDIGYVETSDALEAGKPIHFRPSVATTDADLILLMDVLEHVSDDVGLLSEYVRKAPHGARFLISVPAFQFLWSEHDDFLGHKRRYTLPQLEDVVARAGLVVRHGAYYFGLVFPIAAAIRLTSRRSSPRTVPSQSQLTRHGRFVNAILATLCRVELPIFKFNRLVGLTAFCLAEKTR